MALTYNVNVLNQDGTKVVTSGELQYPTGQPTPEHIRSFPFTFQTAGLSTGVTIFTPTVGQIIYDIGVVITTAFNGTTPKLDVGTFNGGNIGLFGELAGAALDGTKLYADVTDNAGLAAPNAAQWLQAAVGSVGSAGTAAYVSTPLLCTAANPFLLVASQNGQKGGTAISSSAGAGTLYVSLSLPVAF